MPCPFCKNSQTNKRAKTTKLGYHTFYCPKCQRNYNERTGTSYNDLHFPTDIILMVVMWRLRYKLSLRGVAEMFIERGFEFTYEAVREWEERFIPLLTEKLRARRKGKAGISWYIDETYVKKVMNRTNHYLNNRIEQAHRAIKQRYYPMRGFKSFESASRFCSGFDELRNFFKSGPKLSSPVLRRLQYRARIEAYQSIMKAA